MSAVPYRKIDREQVFQVIADLIEKSENGETEISSSELADKFGVQAPTMDYHLKKLIDEGCIAVAPKRGRYNRKIYRLPSNAGEEQQASKAQVHKPFESIESAEKFKKFLQEHAPKDSNVQEELELQPKEEKKPVIETKELTLDERIQSFLEETGQVHDAEVLLKHEDKEILSVMNETIQQTSVYLKDLSEQLSTIKNKQLIQHLIDDRNRMQAQMEHLENELKEARAQINKTIEKYEIDPNRVRFMHQMIISTVDDYMNQPNHALALGRPTFRKKVSKEISDLVRYVLHLEK